MFKDIINALILSGMTESEIGAEVGASQASINRIRNELQSPKYELGAALIALHQKKIAAHKAAA